MSDVWKQGMGQSRRGILLFEKKQAADRLGETAREGATEARVMAAHAQ